MNGKQHLVTGLAAGAAYAGVSGQSPVLIAPLALVAGVAALMPDLDKDNALLSSWLPWLSWLVRRVSCGHRGLTHLVPLWVALAALSVYATSGTNAPWLAPLVGAWWAGGLLHLAEDAMTKDGVPLIPGLWTHWHITPRWFHFRSDSLVATLVAGLITIACIALVLVAYVPAAHDALFTGIRAVVGLPAVSAPGGAR